MPKLLSMCNLGTGVSKWEQIALSLARNSVHKAFRLFHRIDWPRDVTINYKSKHYSTIFKQHTTG